MKYWIAGDDYEYGHAIADSTWEKIKKIKPDAELMGQTWWKVGEPDFTPYITAISSANPDMVILALGGRNLVPFLKAAKATGFNEKFPTWTHTATELSNLRALGKDAPMNTVGTSNYHFYYPETPENKSFVEEFEKRYITKMLLKNRGIILRAARMSGMYEANFRAKMKQHGIQVDDIFEGRKVH